MIQGKNNIIVMRDKNTGEIQCFGSISAMFDNVGSTQIGCTLGTMWNKGLPYENERYEIHRVQLIRKIRNKRT